ncbi:MAG: cupin [Acidimicrobiales bacterium]
MAELEGVTVSRREGRPLSREEAEQKLRDEGLVGEAWQNGPDYNYIAHDHPYTKVLYCVVGSIVFHVRDDSGEVHDIALEPGDRMDLGSGIVHSASVGPNGVICVEGARQAT